VQDSIKNFAKKNPTLQDYEDMLKKFSIVEEEIEKVVEAYKIGAMELKTANIRTGLQTWAKDWKQQYSQDLHKRARLQLD
jgi:hypothetical protein